MKKFRAFTSLIIVAVVVFSSLFVFCEETENQEDILRPKLIEITYNDQ